jgi:hypothetical protein
MTPDPIPRAECRHGVRIDRYCDPCEEGWPNRDEPGHVTPVGAWLVLAAIVLVVLVLAVGVKR